VAPTDPVDLVRRYAEIVTSGDLATLDTILAPDFVQHRPTGPEAGLERMRAFVASVRRELPDLELSVETVFADDAFADGPRVGAVVTLRGTSQRLGRRVAFREIHVYRVAAGKLAERWFAVERAAFPMVVPVDA
jgi:ketosteroid isomerase-like protein